MDSGPLYTIGTVARLTKINPDTLRVWERRYGLGPAQKSASGRRQYNQNELEHLQIISALLSRGYKIGEIAAMERKTLDAVQDREPKATLPHARAARNHVVIIGKDLCEWVNRHQSCLAGMKATVISQELQDIDTDDLLELQPADLLIVGVEKPSERDSPCMTALRLTIGSPPTLVYHTAIANHTRSVSHDILMVKGPMTLALFSSSIKCLNAKAELRIGDSDIASLSRPKSRLFSKGALEDIRQSPAILACDCPSHLSDLIEALSKFESYSSECAVENWAEAATHACVYAYANQARWLIEKALANVMAGHKSPGAAFPNSTNPPM